MQDFFKKLIERLRPRLQFRWILSCIISLAVILYLGFGIYYGIQIYKYKSDSNQVKIASSWYPYPVAFVDNRAIWAKDYFTRLGYIKRYSERSKQTLGDYLVLKEQTLDQLIEMKILQFQGIKYNLSVTSKEADDAYKKITKEVCSILNIGDNCDDTTIKKVLTDMYGMDNKKFKGLIKQEVLKEKIQNELISQVKIAHILIRNEGTANDVMARLKKGENFTELAKQFSEDIKSKETGGELGWTAREQLVVESKTLPELDDAIFKAKVGDLVGPIKTASGFELVKVEDKKGRIEKTYSAWYEELKKNTKIWKVLKVK